MTQQQWLFVSDVDDTLLGDEAALMQLSEAMSQSKNDIILVYNSSRPCASIRRSMTEHPAMPTPAYVVGAMGTEIQKGDSTEMLGDYTKMLAEGWSRDKVTQIIDELGFVPHDAEFQTRFKASYTIPFSILEAAERSTEVAVRNKLTAAGLETKVFQVKGKNLDIIAKRGGKGEAVKYLREALNIDPNYVVVAGDSENDLEMFNVSKKGIVVGNALPILKRIRGNHVYQANAACAAGVLEGLRFWGVL